MAWHSSAAISKQQSALIAGEESMQQALGRLHACMQSSISCLGLNCKDGEAIESVEGLDISSSAS